MATSDLIFTVPRAVRFGALLLVAACGCSKSGAAFAPVEGTVTRNGRPVPHVQVVFFVDGDNQGLRATGLTDDAGRFRLVTDDGKEGAPVGNHRVCVIDTSRAAERFGQVTKHVPEVAAKVPQSKPAVKTAPIPAQYGRPTETPLRAEVRAGAQTIDFQIP